jgi:hypothetical protein
MKDRIDAKFAKTQYSIIKYSGFTLIILSLMQLLLFQDSGISGLDRNIDILILIVFGAVMVYSWYGKKLKNRINQYIEWNENSLTYKLGTGPENTISYENIANINMGQNEILIKLDNNDTLKLDIWDFKKYSDRQRIRRNFEQIQTLRGHKTCRFQWVLERFVPPRSFETVDNDAALQSGTFYTSKR